MPDPLRFFIDGDGDVDVVCGGGDGNILYFKNKGKTDHVVPQTNPLDKVKVHADSSPVVVDWDNDGDLDIVVGNINGTIQYFENDGSDTFVEIVGTANPFDGIDVGANVDPCIVDWDGDGDLDVVVGNGDGVLAYFEQQPDERR